MIKRAFCYQSHIKPLLLVFFNFLSLYLFLIPDLSFVSCVIPSSPFSAFFFLPILFPPYSPLIPLSFSSPPFHPSFSLSSLLSFPSPFHPFVSPYLHSYLFYLRVSLLLLTLSFLPCSSFFIFFFLLFFIFFFLSSFTLYLSLLYFLL